MKRLLAFIRLGRIHFLVGGIVLHLLGVAIALYDGAALNLAALVWGQIAITATQLMTHYANDYFDLEADRANLTPTNWSGGSRVLVETALSPQTALHTALVLAVIALAANLTLSLVVRPSLTTFLLFFLAQMLAWFYSAPPIRLHSRGIGEMTTAIVVTLLTPLVGYYLQAGELALLPLLAVIPLCCLQFAMLLAIEFPDAEGDRQVGKRTLVVRLGSVTAGKLYSVVLVIAYTILPLLVWAGLPLAAGLAVGAFFPLALWLIGRRDWLHPARWNTLAFYTIVLLVGSAAAELIAFTLLIGLQLR
jgi:1,4-dihydroxy-2-naphthoate octaprenyltransferase